MAKGPMYVKDFDFSAQPCNYSYGGSAKAGQDVQMAKSKAVSKSLVGQKMTKMASGGYYAKGGSMKTHYEEGGPTVPLPTPEKEMFEVYDKQTGNVVGTYGSLKSASRAVDRRDNDYGGYRYGHRPVGKAKGGKIKEAATGESYPSRRAMMKHESMETPSMKKDEIMQSRMVKAPMRRAMPVAPMAPMIQPSAMKKGGFVEGGKGMLKPEGTLGIKGNKNPGEMNGKPTMATKTGNVPYKKGGKVAKVMGEFKSGALHSGSKSGPEVKSRKQALAIALSEARAAKKK